MVYDDLSRSSKINFKSIIYYRRWDSVALYMLGGSIYFGWLNVVLNIVLAIVVVVISMRALWLRLDSGLPIIQITAALACIQWLIGPIWYYLGDYSITEMGMAVPKDEYFSLAVPGTAAFCLGLFFFNHPLNLRRVLAPVNKYWFLWIGLSLNAFALLCDVLGRIVPDSLAFAFFLLSQLRYVGVLYLWFAREKGTRLLASLCALPLFLSSAESAMFHDLLIWCGLLFSFWFASQRRTVVLKCLIVLASLLIVFTIQGIKRGYRDKVWQAQKASLSQDIFGFWSNFTEFDTADIFENALIRINQGWIISHVLTHVDAFEPFARGGTIKDSVVAAVVPRFLYKEKAIAGGRSKFTRFTGLPINEQTSMNISLLGEGYANFGKGGACVFLFLSGLGIASAFGYCVRFSNKHPVFIFWIPLIFYQAIKAETDSTEILNQIVKGGFLAFSCYFAVEYFFPTKRRVNARSQSAGNSRSKTSPDMPDSYSKAKE